MPRSSLVARQMAFRLPLLPLQASHRQQRWPTILALHFLDAPFPRAPGTFVLFGAFELRIARLSLLHSRSEEHTSELQSQSNLVCRLLLEKKNDNMYNT